MEISPDVHIRRKKRYNHVTLSLMQKGGAEWEWIKALDWNEEGFNFYRDGELSTPDLLFKKGAMQFRGTVVWNYRNNDDNVILERILNRLLFERIKLLSHDKEIARRIITLSRAPNMPNEKRKLLEALGVPLTDDHIREMVEKHKEDHSLYRYGVRIDSGEWSGIIRKTLELTSVVVSLEKVEQSLSGLNKR